MEAPRYFSSYGAYVPVAASVAQQQRPPQSYLPGGLPAPWSTLQQTAPNPFSNFNAAIQAPPPVAVTQTTENWVEMTLLRSAAPPVQTVAPAPVAQPTIERVQEQVRRCVSCGGYYTNINETCRYHPGLYRAVRSFSSIDDLATRPVFGHQTARLSLFCFRFAPNSLLVFDISLYVSFCSHNVFYCNRTENLCFSSGLRKDGQKNISEISCFSQELVSVLFCTFAMATIVYFDSFALRPVHSTPFCPAAKLLLRHVLPVSFGRC